jgi:hypothetical protein
VRDHSQLIAALDSLYYLIFKWNPLVSSLAAISTAPASLETPSCNLQLLRRAKVTL